MDKFDSDDEFFGDQSSDVDEELPGTPSNGSNAGGENGDITGHPAKVPSLEECSHNFQPFGNISHHERRSREMIIKTTSYLDGYDETKEERIQDGFSDGYQRSFHDAFRIGSELGSLCGKLALQQSLTIGNAPGEIFDEATSSELRDVRTASNSIRRFLSAEVLVGTTDSGENSYIESLSKLNDQLKNTQPARGH